MRKWILAGYGLLAYLVGLIANTYAIGFLGGFEVPRLTHNGDPEPWALALMINTGLLALFGVQHSLMARKSFKQRLTALVPPASPSRSAASANRTAPIASARRPGLGRRAAVPGRLTRGGPQAQK